MIQAAVSLKTYLTVTSKQTNKTKTVGIHETSFPTASLIVLIRFDITNRMSFMAYFFTVHSLKIVENQFKISLKKKFYYKKVIKQKASHRDLPF
jgi:hypothetical protein